MKTVFGQVCDELGIASRRTIEQGETGPRLRHTVFAIPAAEFRHSQPARIPVDISHDHRPVGEVVHLEKRGRYLWAVAHLDGRIDPVAWMGDLFWSASATSEQDFTDIELDWISLTAHPAQKPLEPLVFLPGSLDYPGVTKQRSSWANQLDRPARELLERAATAKSNRTRGAPICIHDDDQAQLDLAHLNRRGVTPVERLMALEEQQWERRPPGPLRHSAPVRGSVIRVH